MRFHITLGLLSTSLLAAAPPLFDTSIKPILKAKCEACHGATPQAGLDLRTQQAVLKGGKSGPAIIPGNSAQSLLLDKIVSGQMPPGKAKLSSQEIEQVRAWIDKSMPASDPSATTETVSDADVRAILQVRCIACHGSERREGGLDLRTLASRLKGGKSGPSLIAGKPEESLLYKRIVSGQMPPDRLAKDLAIELPTPGETEKIRSWIAAGAPGPVAEPINAAIKDADKGFWSFQPPHRPEVPAVTHATLVRNPIDAFLLQKLEAKGLSFSPAAGKLTLMRRLFLDLIGMAPTVAEIDAYVKDTAPDAYEKLVDRLLQSNHYGERWGQHWLDLAGYSDSEGFGQDDGVRTFAWRYRDYVIRALNSDKSYAQFLSEQLAGDELSDDWKNAKGTANQELIDRIAATGFLRTTSDPTDSYERGLISERMNVLADEVEVLASSVMGLTVGCARCHDHKYDPIPQRDYYRLSAILQAAYDPYEWKGPKKREFALGLEDEKKSAAESNAPVQAEIDVLQKKIREASKPYRDKAVDEAIAKLPAEVRAEVSAVAATPQGERTEAQKALAVKYREALNLPDSELPERFKELAEKVKPLQQQLGTLRGKLKPIPHVRVLTDNAEPSVPYLLRRGDPVGFGEPVDPGVPMLLANAALKPYQAVPPFAGSTGRRLALARWMTQPNHPLTSRVAVNQMWSRHFGRGIVRSAANFGRSGAPPTHPELLDWLATEFVNQGWSMKAMHRLMVTSQAYRQSSNVAARAVAADPENELLSRMPMRRMDAETLYDSMLNVTGRLDPALFGAPVDVEITADKEVLAKGNKQGFRRGIYVLHRRQTPVSLLDAFDQPPMTPNCTERRQSNVATQALHMMNGALTWNLARFMAGRIIDEEGSEAAKQVEAVYLRALARRPTPAEVVQGTAALAEFRQQWPARLASDNGEAPREASASWLALANVCHVILNSAEFSFID